MQVFHLLSSHTTPSRTSLTLRDELVLVKLRLILPFQDFAYRWRISRGGWKDVIIRSRAGSNDLLDLCALVNCMHERKCLIKFFAFQNLALSQLSSARSHLDQRQLEELLVRPRYQAPLRATMASNRT